MPSRSCRGDSVEVRRSVRDSRLGFSKGDRAPISVPVGPWILVGSTGVFALPAWSGDCPPTLKWRPAPCRACQQALRRVILMPTPYPSPFWLKHGYGKLRPKNLPRLRETSSDKNTRWLMKINRVSAFMAESAVLSSHEEDFVDSLHRGRSPSASALAQTPGFASRPAPHTASAVTEAQTARVRQSCPAVTTIAGRNAPATCRSPVSTR